MAKVFSDSVFDAALADVATQTTIHVTSAEPANHAGIAAVSLADIAVSSGLGGGDWGAAANGVVSGRRTTLAAQNTVTIDASGTATHVAGTTGTTMKSVTTCTSQALVAAGTVDIPAHDYGFTDPT